MAFSLHKDPVGELGGGAHLPENLRDGRRWALEMERLSLSLGVLRGVPGGTAPLVGT
jgi:hypothetical protein